LLLSCVTTSIRCIPTIPRLRRADKYMSTCRTFTYKAILPDILILNRQTGKFACFQYLIYIFSDHEKYDKIGRKPCQIRFLMICVM
jgi:hypothetical protein